MWIGDFVRCHTVVRLLRTRFPGRPVDVLTTKMVAPLLDYMPGVRKGVVFDLPRKRLALAQHRAFAGLLRAEGRAALIANGVSERTARNTAGSGHGPWYLRPKQGSPQRTLKCVLQIARPPISVPIVFAQLLEPPCTDPYARWCGRGGTVGLPPIPIFDPKLP
jgi:hypothetical protein